MRRVGWMGSGVAALGVAAMVSGKQLVPPSTAHRGPASSWYRPQRRIGVRPARSGGEALGCNGWQGVVSELVTGVYPFITATRFHTGLRAGSGPPRRPGLEPDSAERVAETILDLIRSGEPEAVLIPEWSRADRM